jgi:hypothetical protein
LVFEKGAKFFASNWQKSPKISIITSVPGWNIQTELVPDVHGEWGDWGEMALCPNATYAYAFSLKVFLMITKILKVKEGRSQSYDRGIYSEFVERFKNFSSTGVVNHDRRIGSRWQSFDHCIYNLLHVQLQHWRRRYYAPDYLHICCIV